MKTKSNYILLGIAIVAILLGVGSGVHIKCIESRYETVWAEVTDINMRKIRTGRDQAHIEIKYTYEGKEYEATLLRKEKVGDLKGLYIYCEKKSPQNVIDIQLMKRNAILVFFSGIVCLGIVFCAEKFGWKL